MVYANNQMSQFGSWSNFHKTICLSLCDFLSGFGMGWISCSSFLYGTPLGVSINICSWILDIYNRQLYVLLFSISVQIDFWGWKIPISAAFYLFFGHFRSKGPSVLLLELAREVMKGPRTRNDRKMGKTKAEIRYFSSSEINPHANWKK